MSDQTEQDVTRRETWQRLLYVILFAIIYGVADIIVTAVVVLQFGFVLLTGKRNEYVLAFGGTLSRFLYEILLYLTFKSDDKPFPFSAWPTADEQS